MPDGSARKFGPEAGPLISHDQEMLRIAGSKIDQTANIKLNTGETISGKITGTIDGIHKNDPAAISLKTESGMKSLLVNTIESIE